MKLVSLFKKLVPAVLQNVYHIVLFRYYWQKSGLNMAECKLIGVTGTSGKSTTSSIIAHILNENDYRTGVISTVSAQIGGHIIPTGLHVTTADPKPFVEMVVEMQKNNVEYIIVEMSSHSLEQFRLGNLKFDFAVYTNIKEDHLDWHKTWDKYARAKARLIDRLKSDGVAILNRDDKRAYKFLNQYVKHIKHKHKDRNVKVLSYSVSKSVHLTEERPMEFKYEDVTFRLPFAGIYNVENALVSVKVAEQVGISVKECAKAFRTFAGLKGRSEIMQKRPFKIIIDFAHNTDSLEKSLSSLKSSLGKKKGRLITIFGSAGERDVEKREKMGKVSGSLSDITIITAEDPRTESLKDINSAIIGGVRSKGAKLVRRFTNRHEMTEYLKDVKGQVGDQSASLVFAFDEENVSSRYDAIEFALRIAQSGDIVVTQGKGHEQSLCFGVTEYDYSDHDAIEVALDKISNNSGD